MSSFLPNVIVAETLNKLNLSSRIDQNDLKSKVDAGFARLADFQHEDGGWGWWKEDDSMVFMTAYVVSGLAQAKSAGYEIKDDALDRGKQFLHSQLSKHS